MRREFRLAGEGGQGLITAAIILAAAAAEHTDLNAVQTQSYGPESRGGASKADVIISDEGIDYPEVKIPQVLLVMTQEASDRYGPGLAKGGTLIVDSTYVERVPDVDGKVVRYPISQKARDVGREIVANIVALGLLVGVTGAVPAEAALQAVLARVPKGTEELNRKAFSAGLEAAKETVA
jgi:2-oxoglutarate ferredoxin oxidoreductase subunit gamma